MILAERLEDIESAHFVEKNAEISLFLLHVSRFARPIHSSSGLPFLRTLSKGKHGFILIVMVLIS